MFKLDNFYSYKYDFERREKIYYNNIVLDKFGVSLSNYLRDIENEKEIRDYLKQLFDGLSFIHSLNIVHRDLKPSNLLIDKNKKKLKICDFGSSKIIKNNEKSTPLVTSRFYRAPELLLGSCNLYENFTSIFYIINFYSITTYIRILQCSK